MEDTETVLLSDIRLLTTMKLVDNDLVEKINSEVGSSDQGIQQFIFEMLNDIPVPDRNPQIVAANIFLGMNDTIVTAIDPDVFRSGSSQELRSEQEALLKEYVNNEVVNHPFTFDVLFWTAIALAVSAFTVLVSTVHH